MANNDEYTDEYNDEYLCRDFFVGFNFWWRLSFQISEFRVHWYSHTRRKSEEWRLFMQIYYSLILRKTCQDVNNLKK